MHFENNGKYVNRLYEHSFSYIGSDTKQLIWEGKAGWTIARPLHLTNNQIRRWHHRDLRLHDLDESRLVEIIEAQCMIETCTNILEDKLEHTLNATKFVLKFQHRSKIHIIFKQKNNSKQTSRQTQTLLKKTTLRLWNGHPDAMASSLSNIDLKFPLWRVSNGVE